MKNFKYNEEMRKLLIATHNEGKLAEIKRGLKPVEEKGVKVVSLLDLAIDKKPEETGKTFEENSKLKAEFYANFTKLPTIADDGGLIIPYLNNEPGVKSRRWPGYEANDIELIQYTLTHLKGVGVTDRTAYLQTCLCFYNPFEKIFVCEEEKIKGKIAKTPIRDFTAGYPYRALFIVDKFGKYYDELTPTEHHEVNHRLKALKRLVQRIEKYLIE